MRKAELARLVASYKPSDQVLTAMGQIKVLATVGPSASGKTTVMKALLKQSTDFGFILDETTRSARPGEKDGIDWLFRSVDEVVADARRGELVQLAIGPNGDLYATRLSSYPSNKTGLIGLVPAAVEEFRRLPFDKFGAAFIVPDSYEKWRAWLAKHAKDSGWTDEKLAGRLAEAKQSYEFALGDKEMRFVLNDEAEKAAQRLQQVSLSQAPADEARARAIAEANYQKLQAGL